MLYYPKQMVLAQVVRRDMRGGGYTFPDFRIVIRWAANGRGECVTEPCGTGEPWGEIFFCPDGWNPKR
jgi:hypothetical protein